MSLGLTLNNQPHFPRLPNRAIGPDSFQLLIRVHDGTWTHSQWYHKPPLYQLSYAHSSERWESNPLLLGYEPSVIFRFTPPQVGVTGFEPVTPASQMQCADQTALYSENTRHIKLICLTTWLIFLLWWKISDLNRC